jgi:hypothetical protein
VDLRRSVLRIPTYLGPSAIHGLGVFTPSNVSAGTLIWDLTPKIDWRIALAVLDGLEEPYRSELRSYCYLEDAGTLVLCGDNARFMNHSLDPNCDDPSPTVTIARRDIRAGEELTVDYRLFDFIAAAHPETGGFDTGATLAQGANGGGARGAPRVRT